MSDPETTSGPPPDLAAKIAAVMGAIDEIPKNGTNDYHGYDYATDDDVMGAVRPKMAENNLVSIPSLVERDTKAVKTDNGTTLHTNITLEITLVDADSGASWTISWQGEAQDTQDKGLYKAYTSAIKYAMLKIFLLSADTDVETDDIAGKRSGGSAGAQQPTEGQLDYARDLADKPVWSDEESDDLHDRIGSASRSELSDLIDEMKESVEERESRDPEPRVDRYGYQVLEKHARGIDRRDEALQEKSGTALGDAITAIESEIEDWPDRPRQAAQAMVDTHRDRLEDQIDEETGPDSGQDSDGEEEANTSVSELPGTYPTGFPKASRLQDFGLSSPADLDQFLDGGGDLQSIDQVGASTAEEIESALQELREEWEEPDFEPDDEIPF